MKVFIKEKDLEKAAYVFTLLQILKDETYDSLMNEDINTLISRCQSYGCGKFLDFVLEQHFRYNGVDYYSELLFKNEEEMKKFEVPKP